MIRPTTPEDSEAIITLAVAAEMFSANETEALRKVLADYFSNDIHQGHVWITEEEEGKLRGVAYYAPAPMADRTWYLYMIAVHPEDQRQGHGTALLEYVENTLRTSHQRLLLVETSGLQKYKPARSFYAKCGYDREACIRDFYTVGDDQIVFRKILNAE